MVLTISRLRAFVLIVSSIALLAGCTTFVAGSKKEDGYEKKMTLTSVVWLKPVALRTRISRSAQGYRPQISEEDKANSKAAIAELVKLFADESAAVVSGALQENAVTVASADVKPETRLVLTATSGRTECAPLGCVSSLWISARLYDNELHRFVWRGSFKVGASYFSENDTSVLENFASALMDQLRNSSLI